jgi:hypothetical protein
VWICGEETIKNVRILTLIEKKHLRKTWDYQGIITVREIWRIRCLVYLNNLLLLHPNWDGSGTLQI